MIKIIFSLIFLIIAADSIAGTCTATTRTNYTSGEILTSSALNADFNQLVTKANAFDGGCVSDGTLEKGALSSTDFAAVNNGIHQGCPLVYVDANTVGVGKCILTIGGNYVKTTAQNNVTWACSGCSAEAASTLYYIYAKSDSTGTTLNLLISTTAPGADGYDGSGNKALAKFINDSGSSILELSLSNWSVNSFSNPKGHTFTFQYGGGSTYADCTGASQVCVVKNSGPLVISVVRSLSAGVYDVVLGQQAKSITCSGQAWESQTLPAFFNHVTETLTSTISFSTREVASPYNLVDTYGSITCTAYLD